MHIDVICALKRATVSSAKEHEATRLDIERLRIEAEQQASRLRQEIEILKLELEKRILEAVVKNERGNKAEQNRLHELTNATYKVWAAKEVMLADIMVR